MYWNEALTEWNGYRGFILSPTSLVLKRGCSCCLLFQLNCLFLCYVGVHMWSMCFLNSLFIFCPGSLYHQKHCKRLGQGGRHGSLLVSSLLMSKLSKNTRTGAKGEKPRKWRNQCFIILVVQGQQERDQCYRPILEELERLFPDRSNEKCVTSFCSCHCL